MNKYLSFSKKELYSNKPIKRLFSNINMRQNGIYNLAPNLAFRKQVFQFNLYNSNRQFGLYKHLSKRTFTTASEIQNVDSQFRSLPSKFSIFQ